MLSRGIHEATIWSAQWILALTPLFLLISTLLTLAVGVCTISLKILNEEDIKREHEIKFAKRLRRARNFAELCTIFGFPHEEHVVTTPDGYLLTLQRILPKGYCNKVRDNLNRPVVFLQHGLCTNSEFFMVITDVKRCLPLTLLEKGYDVWLGNNRGNKYSRHTTLPNSSPTFWDYCIDDLASSDIPSFVSYILAHTKQPKLSYIGFSQGSAQCLAALSTIKELNDKLEVFIALAPIIRPRAYASAILNQCLKWRPTLLYTVFGSEGLFPSVTTIQRILPSLILRLCIDISVLHLLGYRNNGISKVQKLAAYPHLFCPTSVKTVVHWTHIMIQGEFARFQPESLESVNNTPGITVKRYPTENITAPIVLIHGDSDGMFEVETALERLPCGSGSIRCFELKGYEHIDVVWGRNVHIDVIPRVLEVLP